MEENKEQADHDQSAASSSSPDSTHRNPETSGPSNNGRNAGKALSAKGEAALHHFLMGFAVVAILPGTKRPAEQWQGECREVQTEAAVRDHWLRHPDHDIAIIAGDDVLVADTDTPESTARLCEIEKAHDIVSNRTVKTARGEHRYYKLAPGVKAKSFGGDSSVNPEVIDLRTGSALAIVPPSTDKCLLVDEAAHRHELVPVTQAFVDAINRNNGRTPNVHRQSPATLQREEKHPPDEQRLREILERLDPDMGYTDWITVGMGLHHEYRGDPGGLELFDAWSSQGKKYKGRGDLERAWRTFSSDHINPVTMGSLVHLAGMTSRSDVGARPSPDAQPGAQTPDRARASSPPGFEKSEDQDATVVAFRSDQDVSASPCAGKTLPDVIRDIEEAEPLDPTRFPNQRMTQSGGISLPATVANVRFMLEQYDIRVFYNVIEKQVEIRVPGFSGCPDNADNSTLTHCISLATLNGIAIGQVPDYIAAIADRNQYNPVMEYIHSKPWDGIDRLEALFGTLTLKEDFPAHLAKTFLRKWLISAVAAADLPSGFLSRGVLVLQGPQSIGKTAFFRALVDDPALRDRLIQIDHHLDASNKDSILTAVSHWIVEIGELDSSFKKDVARLKGFITDSVDKVRRPYDRKDSEYPRRTVFCASVNSPNFLVDETGNTRWWTIPVTAINYNHGIDMQQLWAQVLQIYQAGEQWWLTPEEEAQLEEQNRGHRSVNAVRDMLEDALDFDIPESERKPMTATEVLRHLDVTSPTNPQTRDCGTYLREVLGEPTRSRGKTRWHVPLKKQNRN